MVSQAFPRLCCDDIEWKTAFTQPFAHKPIVVMLANIHSLLALISAYFSLTADCVASF
jgi:hypothetical protein